MLWKTRRSAWKDFEKILGPKKGGKAIINSKHFAKDHLGLGIIINQSVIIIVQMAHFCENRTFFVRFSPKCAIFMKIAHFENLTFWKSHNLKRSHFDYWKIVRIDLRI